MMYVRFPLSLRQLEDLLHNHFNQERHLYNRENLKLNRSAALAEWRQLST
jgi:hypothetical protein